MKAFRTYMDLIFKLISFKFNNPEYAKQIEKALPILVDEEVIAAIDADLNTLEEDDKKQKKQDAYKIYYRRWFKKWN